MDMRRIMVIGASGVLGKLICIELIRIFNNEIKLIVTDYKHERGKELANSLNNDVEFKFLDVNNLENIKQVMKNIDIVVVGLKQESPIIQEICINNKILCVDVTPFHDFVEKVNLLNQSAKNHNTASIVMSGFFPGLSGLMVKKAISNFDDVIEINVGLLQNTNAKAGITGVLDMLKIISQQVRFESKIISGFTKKRKMYFANQLKEKEVRLIHHSEKIVLQKQLTVNSINYWTSWNVNTFNKLVSFLRRIGFIEIVHKLNNKVLPQIVKHNPNKNENAYLTVEVKGIIDNKEKVKIVSISTFSDYHTTAMVTAALIKIAQQKKLNGVIYPFEVVTLDDLLSEINCINIVIEEFEK